jgi:uncharacterized protein
LTNWLKKLLFTAARPQEFPELPEQDKPTVRDTTFGTGHYRESLEQGKKLLERQQSAMAKTFQRGIESLRPNNIPADAKPGEYALDEAYPDLTQAKLVNARAGYLPIPQLEWFAAQGFIGWQMCAILSQHWLIDKACGVPAQDAVRNGYDILFDDGEKLDPKVMNAFKKADKRINIQAKACEFIKMGRVFGIRHALFLIDGIDYEAPFNPDGIRPNSYRGIVQIDPYWMAPELDSEAAANPASPEFYNPTWWRVNSKRIHRSHFIIDRCGDEVADILKPSYYYGGIPIPQKIYARVYPAERTADEAPMLAASKRMTIYKTDVTKWFGPDSKAQARIQEWIELQNNFGVKVIGSEEEVTQFETSLAALDETIMTQFQLVAAACSVPATKLMGTAPKGFNSTGEYDEASYHEELESIQENAATPFIERHHLCLYRSVIAPKFGLDLKRTTEINWRPTDSMTAKEEAEVNEIKSRAAANYVSAGAIDGYDVRRNLIDDPDSGYTGIEEMVPDGPGDREAEAEMKAALLEGANENNANANTPDKAAMDEAPAAGIIWITTEGKVLLMQDRLSGFWSFPGGKVEQGESTMQTACREFEEETGKRVLRCSPAWSDPGFALFAVVAPEFTPTLSGEHSAYVWANPMELPFPLHRNVNEQIELVCGEATNAPPSNA